jgi:hypothetical protein
MDWWNFRTYFRNTGTSKAYPGKLRGEGASVGDDIVMEMIGNN